MLGRALKRSVVVVAVLVALVTAGTAAPSAAPPAPNQATAYQIDPAHDGSIADAGLAAPLTQAWSITLPDTVSYPLIVNGTVFVTANSTLYAIDQATGDTLWSHQIGGSTGLTYDRGSVFAQGGNLVTAFDASTGAIAWSVQLPGQWSFTSPPTAANGIVYTGGAGDGGTVYALRESDGKLLWTQGVANGDDSSPTVDAQGVYVSYACQQAYKFDPLSGALLWHHNTFCEGGGGDTTVLADGILFVRDWAIGDILLSASNGSEIGPLTAGPPPAVANGVAYILNGSNLTAVANAGLGTTNWSFAGDGHLDTPPVVADGLVFVGSSLNTLFAFDAGTGATIWSTSLSSAPTDLAAANGTLVVSAGTQLTAFRTAGAITTAPASQSVPTVTGSEKTTEVQVADVGVWSGLPSSYAYQWELCDASGANCADILGAMNPTFTPPAGDLGSTLRVKVTATNGVGSSDPVESAASPPLAEGGTPTTISLTPSQSSILGGGQVTLTAQVTGTLVGTVALYGTPQGGSKALLTFGSVGSAGPGAVAFPVSPTVTTTYTAVLKGGQGYASSTSPDAQIVVVPRSLPISASHATVTYGKTITLKLTGVKASGEVDLYATPADGPKTLVKAASVAIGQHTVTFTVSPQIRTTYFAERADQAAASDDLTVAVRPSLALKVHGKRISAKRFRQHGQAFVIAAGEKPALYGEPLWVAVERAGPDGSWTSVGKADVPLDSNGVGEVGFKTKKPGRYRVRSSYVSDGVYASAHSRWRHFKVG